MSKAKKKLKYAVIQSTDLKEFCKQCNCVLELNYVPIGGVAAVNDTKNHNTIIYSQSFTYENNENN